VISTVTPWSRAILEKVIVLQLIAKFPEYYGTSRVIATFIKIRCMFIF
jgi:hypothetical protein